MKALYFEQHGRPDVLKYGDIAKPSLKPGEVLVRVRACALNHLDLWVLGGWPGLKLEMPHVGGSDVAGEIAELGEGVIHWQIGDRVVVNPGIIEVEDEWTRRGEESVSPYYGILGETRRGGFAQFVSVPAANLMKIPSDFDYTEACAPLLVALTAWRMLKVRAALTAGQSVLIVGAGGGLNNISLQLAKHFGATVIALSSSEEKLQKCLSLGAHHAINYRQCPDWSREVKRLTNGRGVDVVVDNVGAKTMEQSLRAVARGGKIVTVGNTSGPMLSIDNRLIFTKQISIIGSTMGSKEDFQTVMPLVWNRKIASSIDCVLPLEKGREAYERIARGEQFGKIVLTAQS
ncbi:MAG: zinc-binding dehydrogenase [Deltaproteobacteria bacterium]|nr:zinc-binding dehydrogenase [Deltaproteobacteria bacterium]